MRTYTVRQLMWNLHDDHQSIGVITQVRMPSQDIRGPRVGGAGVGREGERTEAEGWRPLRLSSPGDTVQSASGLPAKSSGIKHEQRRQKQWNQFVPPASSAE